MQFLINFTAIGANARGFRRNLVASHGYRSTLRRGSVVRFGQMRGPASVRTRFDRQITLAPAALPPLTFAAGAP
ncbi:hypothetical protein OE810_12445 [Rhodobacteraceae bacterium XHP0102]|nr:hypothetical protein [Rhodobacteraceae bacterium XHP0102]